MRQTSNRIDEEAARWVARLDAGALPEDERRELDAWLAADPRHHGAFIRARVRWLDLERVGSLAAGRTPGPQVPAAAKINRRFLLAASLGGVVAAGTAWLSLRPSGERFVTGVGEMRRIALADGSTLVLNTASEAVVRLGTRRREVQLVGGEVLCTVAHDPDRPFVVTVDELRVRAVGTVFAVRRRGEKVDVTVSEGVVEVARGSVAQKADARRLTANEQTTLAPKGATRVEKLKPEAMKRRLAWLNGMVAFDGEPLSEAVAEINRHSLRRIIVDDELLAARPVVGVFRASDAAGFSEAAAAALGATTVEKNHAIHLRLQAEPSLAPTLTGRE